MRAELLEDDRSLDDPEAEAAVGLRHAASAKTPSSASSRQAPRSIGWPSRCGDPLEREPRRAEPAHGVLELELLFVEAEVHARRSGPALARNI